MTVAYSLFLVSKPNTQTFLPKHNFLIPVYLSSNSALSYPSTRKKIRQGYDRRAKTTKSFYWQAAGLQKGSPFDLKIEVSRSVMEGRSHHYSKLSLSFIDSQTNNDIRISELELQMVPTECQIFSPSTLPLHDLQSMEIMAKDNRLLARELTPQIAHAR